jgi:hypothetical protein
LGNSVYFVTRKFFLVGGEKQLEILTSVESEIEAFAHREMVAQSSVDRQGIGVDLGADTTRLAYVSDIG